MLASDKHGYRKLVALASAVTSPTAVAGATPTAGVTGFAAFHSIQIIGTLLGNAGGVLDVYVQHYIPELTKWFDLVHFKQVAVSAAAATYVYSPAVNDAIVQVGFDLTPALAEDSVAGAPWADQLRALFVPGPGTVAGAAQSLWVLGTGEEQ